MGLVRFVHPSHGGRTIRYRHVADERWHLSKAELGVLAVLVLRGPQTAGEVRSRVRLTEERAPSRRSSTRSPRAAPTPSPSASSDDRASARPAGRTPCPACPTLARRLPEPVAQKPVAASPDLARDVAELWRRVERLERQLGLSEALPDR